MQQHAGHRPTCVDGSAVPGEVNNSNNNSNNKTFERRKSETVELHSNVFTLPCLCHTKLKAGTPAGIMLSMTKSPGPGQAIKQPCWVYLTLEPSHANRALKYFFRCDTLLLSKRVCPELRQDPPLDLSFWSFLTFLHHGIEEVERHLLWKFHKQIQRKSWSNVPPKLVACIRFLYKVVHKTAVSESSIALARLNLTFFPPGLSLWNLPHLFIMFMATKPCLRFFNFCLGT